MLVFLVGMLGALSREVFRWRKLYVSGRLQKYLTVTYILIAGVIVVLAGLSALIFAPFLAPDSGILLPFSFVIGAGFELLVQQAAKLRMPSVPMGTEQGSERPTSVGEFLRA